MTLHQCVPIRDRRVFDARRTGGPNKSTHRSTISLTDWGGIVFMALQVQTSSHDRSGKDVLGFCLQSLARLEPNIKAQ